VRNKVGFGKILLAALVFGISAIHGGDYAFAVSANPIPSGGTTPNGVAIQDPTSGAQAPVDGTNGLAVHCTSGCSAGGTSAVKLQDSAGGDATNTTAHSSKVTPYDSAGNDATDTTNHAIKAVQAGLIPNGATQAVAYATGAAAASTSATLTGASSQYSCVTEILFTTQAPAALEQGTATLSDGTLTLPFQIVENTAAGGYLSYKFSPPLQSSATNTNWVGNIPAITGGAIPSVVVKGYTRAGGC